MSLFVRPQGNRKKLTKTVTIKVSREYLLEYGLVACTTMISQTQICGHPPNNHFDNGRCAHCPCQSETQSVRIGRVV